MDYYNRYRKKLLLLGPDNRKFLAVYKNISGERVEIFLMLILSNVLILEKWV